MVDSCYMWRRDGFLQHRLAAVLPPSDAGD
jgi:hypothetical protein